MSLKPTTSRPDPITGTADADHPTRRHRAPRLRSLVQATPYLVRTQPWVPLAGAAGLGILIVATMSYFVGPFQRPADLIAGLRAAFAATAIGVGFVLSDPAEDLLEAVPMPAWTLRAVRVAIAIPVLALGGAGELILAARGLTADERLQGLGHRPLAWPGLTLELVGFCGLALLAAAAVDRVRWRDLGGVIAAPLGLGLIAALALAPLALLPTAYLLGATNTGHAAWISATWSWSAVAAVSVLLAGWASRDRWQRLRSHVSAPQATAGPQLSEDAMPGSAKQEGA